MPSYVRKGNKLHNVHTDSPAIDCTVLPRAETPAVGRDSGTKSGKHRLFDHPPNYVANNTHDALHRIV